MTADPTERALQLLSLLQTHRFWPGEELTERLGVSARTLRRDVDRLRSLGYPVDATPGTGGGYRLGAGAHLPPLLLDDDEAVAIAVGLRSAASASIEGMEDTAVRALAKLEQVLPDRLRRRVLAVHTNVASLQWGDGGPVVDADALAVLALACRDREQVRFDYRRRDGDDSSRLVEPFQLVSTGRRWYLVAWDVDRDDWRTFRVDRIAPRIPTGPRFTPREVPELATTNQGVAYGGYRYRARILVHAPAAEVADRYGPNVASVTPIDEATTLVETGANSLDQVALYLGILGLPFEVQDPPELVDAIRELTTRLSASIAGA